MANSNRTKPTKMLMGPAAFSRNAHTVTEVLDEFDGRQLPVGQNRHQRRVLKAAARRRVRETPGHD